MKISQFSVGRSRFPSLRRKSSRIAQKPLIESELEPRNGDLLRCGLLNGKSAFHRRKDLDVGERLFDESLNQALLQSLFDGRIVLVKVPRDDHDRDALLGLAQLLGQFQAVDVGQFGVQQSQRQAVEPDGLERRLAVESADATRPSPLSESEAPWCGRANGTGRMGALVWYASSYLQTA
jgi:hypothetical protein